MSEPSDNSEVAEAPAVRELGNWLRSAREAKSLSAASVAEALRLDTAIVENLEAEAFDSLGALVFVKGHLRAIASHLGLDGDEALDRLTHCAGLPKDAEPELIVSYNRPIRKNTITPAIVGLAAVVALAAFAIALWVYWPTAADAEPLTGAESQVEPEATTTSVVTPAAQTEDNTRSSASEALAAARQAARESAAERSAAAATTETTASTGVAPSTSPSQPSATVEEVGVRLQFSDTCWFEVRDASDRRLAYGTATQGTDRLIRGARPLKIIVGVAAAVSVSVDGTPYTISPAERRGRSARLTIE